MKATEALAEIQKGIRAYKAFSEMEKALEYVANLEQVEKETLAKIGEVKTELAGVDQALAEAKADITAAKDEAKKVRAKAKESAEDTINKAEHDAAAIVEAANKKADNAILVAANAEAQLEELKEKTKAQVDELIEIENRLQAAKAQVNKLLNS